MHIRSIVIFLSIVTLSACSGSGGETNSSSSSKPGDRFALHFDTGSGGADHLVGRLLAVAVEDSAGEISQNLLNEPTNIVIADPSGETHALSLRRPSANREYVAMHLLFDPSGLIALSSVQGSGSLTMTRPDVRVPIELGWRSDSGSLLQLSHIAPPDTSGGSWSPSMSIKVRTDIVVEGRGTVVSVNQETHRLELELEGHHGHHYEFEWTESSLLFDDDGRPEDRATFFGRCGIGTNLSLNGLVIDDRHGWGHSARRHHSHSEDRLLGTITAIDAGGSRLTVEVHAFVGPQGSRLAGQITVRVDVSGAKIYYSHHSIHQFVGFETLKLGMLVEIEGHATTGGDWIATEVEIEDGSSRGSQNEIEGRVAAVDLGLRIVTVRPRGNDPLIVGGRRVQSLDVEVPIGVPVYRRHPDGPIELSAVTSRDRIWIRGVESSQGVVIASWIRVREE